MVLYDLSAAEDRCVYDVRHGMESSINEYGLSQKYDVQVTLSVSECLADLSILDGMETVFVSGVHSHERNIILKHCVGKGINMFVIPRVGDVIMSGAWPMHMFHLRCCASVVTWLARSSCSLSARWTL